MRVLVFAMFSLCSTTALTQDASFNYDLIRDPVISRRCKTLLKDRENKIAIRQKLNSMLLRNERLEKELKPQQNVSRQRLKLNKTQLKNNLRLTALRIKSMEEDIVRKGCPGITL